MNNLWVVCSTKMDRFNASLILLVNCKKIHSSFLTSQLSLYSSKAGVSNSEWLAGHMRLKERSRGPHWKKWKKLPSNFHLKTKNSCKNRHIVYKFLRNSIIFRCSRAALDPLGGCVFETAVLRAVNPPQLSYFLLKLKLSKVKRNHCFVYCNEF